MQFLADLPHIVNEYKVDVDPKWREGADRDLEALEGKVKEAEKRALDVKQREKKLIKKTVELGGMIQKLEDE